MTELGGLMPPMICGGGQDSGSGWAAGPRRADRIRVRGLDRVTTKYASDAGFTAGHGEGSDCFAGARLELQNGKAPIEINQTATTPIAIAKHAVAISLNPEC
jgi:hypothetical protein